MRRSRETVGSLKGGSVEDGVARGVDGAEGVESF